MIILPESWKMAMLLHVLLVISYPSINIIIHEKGNPDRTSKQVLLLTADSTNMVIIINLSALRISIRYYL